MQFTDIIYDLVLENQNIERHVTKLINQWNLNPTDENIALVKTMVERFDQIQNGLRPDLPQARTFLRHFNGHEGFDTPKSGASNSRYFYGFKAKTVFIIRNTETGEPLKFFLTSEVAKPYLSELQNQVTTALADGSKYFTVKGDKFLTRNVSNPQSLVVEKQSFPDGDEHGLEKKFDPKNLKNLFTYSFEQLKFLISEYTQLQIGNNVQDAELLKQSSFSEEMAELSKKLWFDESTTFLNLGTTRVYQPMNQQDSIKFGWYEDKMNRVIGPTHSWCITWRPGQGSNRWGSYREQGRTFYFVIDETKYNEDDPRRTNKYYLGALQICPNERLGYRITNLLNDDNDKAFSWEEVIQIYPALAEHRDELKPMKFTQSELSNKDVIGMINETPGNEYEFARMPREAKERYINTNEYLVKPTSWFAMDDSLRELYITITNSGARFQNKFGNLEFLYAVKSTGHLGLLNTTMIKKYKEEMRIPQDQDFPEGQRRDVKWFVSNLMKNNDYKFARTGLANPAIKLVHTRSDRYGLWDSNANWWLTKNKVEYPAIFLPEGNPDILFDVETKLPIQINTFKDDYDNYFYCLIPITKTSKVDCYFISEKTWNEIESQFTDNQGSVEMLKGAADLGEGRKI